MLNRDYENKTQGFSGMAGAQDIVLASEALNSIEIQNAMRNRDIVRQSQYLKHQHGAREDSINLIISHGGNIQPLLGFVGELDKTLTENDSFGNITKTAYSGNDAVVTIDMQPSKFNSFIHKLNELTRVDTVEELPQEVRIYPREASIRQQSFIEPLKNIRLSLTGAVLSKQPVLVA